MNRFRLLCLLTLAVSVVGGPARAAGSAAPGRAVGHVFLGMDRADVWKVLGRPSHTDSVPHGMALYGEDRWENGGHTLWVVSQRDKVIQIEFNSPRIATTDGLTPRSTLAQVRRRYPALSVRLYFLKYAGGFDSHLPTDGYYLDDERRGIAFTVSAEEGIDEGTLLGPLDTIIIHRPGVRAVPIYDAHSGDGRWLGPSRDPKSLRLMRSWFTPGGSAGDKR